MEREVIIASTEENDAVLENGEVINIPIKTANTIAQTYLENISSDDLYEAEAALKDLNALVQRVIQQTVKAGDADDWHNFAVDIGRTCMTLHAISWSADCRYTPRTSICWQIISSMAPLAEG